MIYRCPLLAFRCNYGACIDGNKKCDGRIDCIDGSDESDGDEEPEFLDDCVVPYLLDALTFDTSASVSMHSILVV